MLVEQDHSLICPTGQEVEMEGWNVKYVHHHYFVRSRISHVWHMSADPLLVLQPVLCNVVLLCSYTEQGGDAFLVGLLISVLSRARNPLSV